MRNAAVELMAVGRSRLDPVAHGRYLGLCRPDLPATIATNAMDKKPSAARLWPPGGSAGG
jgi:hypothetical protein